VGAVAGAGTSKVADFVRLVSDGVVVGVEAGVSFARHDNASRSARTVEMQCRVVMNKTEHNRHPRNPAVYRLSNDIRFDMLCAYMARLGEVPYVIRKIGVVEFARRLLREISADGVFNMAAAVAFYWLLALFPLLIFLTSLAAILPQDTKLLLDDKITTWIYSNLAKEAADAVWGNFQKVLKEPRGGLLSLGLVLTLWAASNGMNATMAALDRCYDVTKPRPFWLQRLVAIGVTVGVVAVVLMVIVLLPVTTLVLKYFDRSSEFVPTFAQSSTVLAINVSRYALGVLLVILLVSSIYQFGVSIRRRLTLISPGAVFTVFGVMAMAYGFNWYLQHFGAESYNKTYAGLGGVIILLLMFYLYAVVFLIGAEINSEIDFEVMGVLNDETSDPLPRIHAREDIERYRRMAEKRGLTRKFK
jgi:membrane protein